MDECQSKKAYRKILKKTTVQELKGTIKKLFCRQEVTNISLFATNDQIKFVKVDSNNDVSVGEIWSDGQIVCYLEECEYSACWPVNLQGVEIGKVYEHKEDTKKIAKLRVQDQLGIPSNYVKVNIVYDRDFIVTVHDVEVLFPLLDCGIWDDSKLVVDRPYIFLILMQDGEYGPRKVFRKLSKKTSVRELKDIF